MYKSKVSRVSEVSTVSEVSKMSKQGEQQSLHSLRPLGEGGRRPDEGADKSALTHCETTKESHKSVCPPLEGGPKSLISRRGADKSALTYGEKMQCNGNEMLKQVQHDVPRHEATEPASCKFLSWICSTLTETRLRSVAPAGSFRSLSGLTSFRPSANPLITQSLSHLITSKKAAFTLAEGRPACTTTQVAAKAAFTLAEVLITLAVIGIVAALTLPGLIQNHNEKAWSTAKDLWEKKLTETVRRMNTDGVMTGHDSTEDFMDTFKQYMKVIKTCDNTDINKCYSPKVVTTGNNEEPMEVETDSLTSASSMGLTSWQTNTNTMSFVVADGTTVIMAYQPECPYADPIEDTGSQVSCMGYMVDVNGKKGPNRVGKDIQLSSGVAFSTCDNPIGDMCWSTDFAANTAINTCDDTTYDKNGSANAWCDTNYWAGAIKSCKDKGMELPTRAQLAELASNLYVDSNGNEVTIGATESKSNLKVKDEYKDNSPITLGYDYWSSEEYTANRAYYRVFSTPYTYGSDINWYYKTNSDFRAVCLGS